MTRFRRFFWVLAIFFAINATSVEAAKDEQKKEPAKKIETNIKIPYERPIGFTLNLGALTSMTFEGRFLLGLAPHLSLVLSPSYQHTIQLPFYHLQDQELAAFNIKRLNLGVGVRGHFYEYDSRDGLFIEGMSRFGMTWAGADPFMWSIIPSLIFGYAKEYESGYTVSFGVGLEWELLLGKANGKDAEFLRTAYYGLTKVPLTGELAIGWGW